MRTPRSLTAIWCLSLATMAAAQQGQDVYRLHGTRPGGHLGLRIGSGEFSVTPDTKPDIVALEESRVLVFEGPDLVNPLERIDLYQAFSENCLAIQDVDLDGIPDLLVTAEVNNYPVLYYGPVGSRTRVAFPTPNTTPNIGRILGNVTSTAHPDLYFAYGPPGAWNQIYDFNPTLPGWAWSGNGQDAVGMGDANGDGYDEFAILSGSSIQVWVGGTSLPWSPSWQVDPLLGGAATGIAAMADLNGDGWAEIVVGNANFGGDSGAIALLSGVDGTEMARFIGNPGQALGAYDRIATGDLDGDGEGEIILGSPSSDPNGMTDAGAIIVLDLNGSSLQLMQMIAGDNAGDQLGRSVAVVGDIDGNGKLNFAAGAPYADPFTNVDAGSVWVFEGSGSPTPRLEGPSSAAAGSSLTLFMEAAHPGDLCLWLASGNLRGSVVFGEVFDIGDPILLAGYTHQVPMVGSASLSLPLPLRLPPAIHFQNLLIPAGGGPFGPKESTNPWTVQIQ